VKYRYAYKTSDGTRHEDSVEAVSREEAFAVLREKGIRPIKVVAANGSKANGETRFVTRKRFVVAALVVGLVLGVAAVLWVSRTDFRDKRLIDFERRGAAIVAEHERMVGTLHLEALRNYREIFDGKGMWIINQKIGLTQFNFKEVRHKLKALFLEAYGVFPAESCPRERTEAERIYQRMMDAVDLGEARLANDAKAFHLLDSNRGKWTVKNGRIEWSDASLAADFASYTRDLK